MRSKRGKSIIVRGVTWSCPRCGAVFTTEVQRNIHLLGCGGGKLPIMWF